MSLSLAIFFVISCDNSETKNDRGQDLRGGIPVQRIPLLNATPKSTIPSLMVTEPLARLKGRGILFWMFFGGLALCLHRTTMAGQHLVMDEVACHTRPDILVGAEGLSLQLAFSRHQDARFVLPSAAKTNVQLARCCSMGLDVNEAETRPRPMCNLKCLCSEKSIEQRYHRNRVLGGRVCEVQSVRRVNWGRSRSKRVV